MVCLFNWKRIIRVTIAIFWPTTFKILFEFHYVYKERIELFLTRLAFFTNYQVKFALMSAFFFLVRSVSRLQISFFNKYNSNIASAFPLYTYLNHLPLFITPFPIWYAHNPLPLLEDYKDYHDIRNSSFSHILSFAATMKILFWLSIPVFSSNTWKK